MIDTYTKVVLTIIAVALVIIVCQHGLGAAIAGLGSDCGDIKNPCYVATFLGPLEVKIVN